MNTSVPVCLVVVVVVVVFCGPIMLQARVMCDVRTDSSD